MLGHSEALVNHSAPSVSYGYFCAFSGQKDTGTSIPMWHCTRCRIPWTANGSWTNNQTTGTIANFLDDSGVSNDEIVREGAARMLAAALEVEVNAYIAEFESAQHRWRAVSAPLLGALVRAGARFEGGRLIERPTERAA
ncbi:hypothetical protein ABT300_41445 [Streptomyces sp. NPDC001027]|uniref:hypothetical protein n=1 Tax=Streptomyces sp. NPDC001027 TaxID=3154771 RepID=UPI003330F13A